MEQENTIHALLDEYGVLFQQKDMQELAEDIRKLKILFREAKRSHYEAVLTLARHPLGSKGERIQERINYTKRARDYYFKELQKKQKIYLKRLSIDN